MVQRCVIGLIVDMHATLMQSFRCDCQIPATMDNMDKIYTHESEAYIHKPQIHALYAFSNLHALLSNELSLVPRFGGRVKSSVPANEHLW